jgi:hypothetical protein
MLPHTSEVFAWLAAGQLGSEYVVQYPDVIASAVKLVLARPKGIAPPSTYLPQFAANDVHCGGSVISPIQRSIDGVEIRCISPNSMKARMSHVDDPGAPQYRKALAYGDTSGNARFRTRKVKGRVTELLSSVAATVTIPV